MAHLHILEDSGQRSQSCLRQQDSNKMDLRWCDEGQSDDLLRFNGRLSGICRHSKNINESESQLYVHSIPPPSQDLAKKPEDAYWDIKLETDNQDITRDDTRTVMNNYDYNENTEMRKQQNPDITQQSPLQSSQSTTNYMHYQPKHHHQHYHHKTRYQPQPSCNLTSSSTRQMSQQRRISITANLFRNIISIFILNTILNHLSHMNHLQASNDKRLQMGLFDFFSNVQAEPTVECVDTVDCGSLDRICHENKCLCHRSRPIEDKERSVCLPLAIINEPCSMSEQCLGQSICTDGYCSCGSDNVTLYNPSTKIHYCHPKRRLNEECNHDLQCPTNAFCSTKKFGCLCQNGYGPATVKNADGIELVECLPKTCSSKNDCESEFHICEENRCTCLATHFDPHTAACYKFGSTGGKLEDNSTDHDGLSSTRGNITSLADGDDGSKGFSSILKDLMRNSDKLWLVVIILILLTLILLALMTIILRRYYLGYCWTTHKKEYEPNNECSPKASPFNKNLINNQSFRKKTSELDDDSSGADDIAADSSNLVTTASKKDTRGPLVTRNGSDNINGNHYVKVDMRKTSNEIDVNQQQSFERSDSSDGHNQRFNHQALSRPLASSLSTPV